MNSIKLFDKNGNETTIILGNIASVATQRDDKGVIITSTVFMANGMRYVFTTEEATKLEAALAV